jgi:ribosomal protein S18 acetylase RimI-like enzyme
MGIEVREARPDEASLIHRMILAIAEDSGQGDRVVSSIEDIERDGFGDRRAFGTLLASRGSRVIGMALYFPEYSTWRGQRGCYLLDLYVTPEERSQGIGRLLVTALARRAREQGAAYLRLSVDEHSTRALAFYRRLGFAEAARDRLLLIDDRSFEAIASE